MVPLAAPPDATLTVPPDTTVATAEPPEKMSMVPEESTTTPLLVWPVVMLRTWPLLTVVMANLPPRYQPPLGAQRVRSTACDQIKIPAIACAVEGMSGRKASVNAQEDRRLSLNSGSV
jgi:hypothetical protein